MPALVKRITGKLQHEARKIWLAFPKKVTCNVCGWQGRHFVSDSWHAHTNCPGCGSEVRHRLLVMALAKLVPLSYQKLVQGKQVLHFAPEPLLQNLIKGYARRYVTADFLRPDVELKLDMCDMPQVQSAEYDLVIACDVLEHVPDDERALAELYRILRPGGYAILTVPQKDDLAETFEDDSIVNPAERERVFGQSDHVRLFGQDFVEIVEQAGFKVKIVSEENFDRAMVKKFVLFPPVLSSRPLATNYRKIYFARKGEAE